MPHKLSPSLEECFTSTPSGFVIKRGAQVILVQPNTSWLTARISERQGSMEHLPQELLRALETLGFSPVGLPVFRRLSKYLRKLSDFGEIRGSHGAATVVCLTQPRAHSKGRKYFTHEPTFDRPSLRSAEQWPHSAVFAAIKV